MGFGTVMCVLTMIELWEFDLVVFIVLLLIFVRFIFEFDFFLNIFRRCTEYKNINIQAWFY